MQTSCRYLRSQPAEFGLLRLGTYLNLWGWVYLAFTLLLLLKHERRFHTQGAPRSSSLDMMASACCCSAS